MITIETEPLSRVAFAPYGDVVESSLNSSPANQNTAKRSNFVSSLINLRSDKSSLDKSLTCPNAIPNVCVFRVIPTKYDPFPLRLLERHKYSTQMFIPMFTTSSPAKYLIIVALNDPSTDKPDLSTLKAFVGDSTQGINYKCGCWHHPIVVFTHDSETKYVDFTCVVYERGEDQIVDSEDTEEVWYVGDDAERKMDIKIFGLRLKSKL